MKPYELAIARQRTYHLFGRLFLQGITADLLPQLQASSELAAAAQPFDSDLAAADHYQLTSVTLFPYEAIFLDPSGLLGGSVTDQVTTLYLQSGYEVLSDSDHLGHELGFLAHLCSTEAAALAAGDETGAALWRSRQQAFLAAHLLRWLPPLTVAIEQSGSPFYGRLANLTFELAVDHLGTQPARAPIQSLPQPPQFAGEENSLKEIAAFLTTPPYSGIFLSRDGVAQLARRHELPRGFGSRAQMLTNLLRTAGQYDMAADVINDLENQFRDWGRRYEDLLDGHPEINSWIQPWQERASRTADSLLQITAELRQSGSQAQT